jgi:hypothetical protein
VRQDARLCFRDTGTRDPVDDPLVKAVGVLFEECMVVVSRWRVAAGVVCLLLGPVGQLVQFLVSPVRQADAPAAQVAAAAGYLPAMRLALILDPPILLILPAVLYAGFVAGADRSRLAAAGTALTFTTALGAGYLLAQDVVVYEAALQPDRAASVGLVAAYEGNGVVSALVVAYLLGHLVGFVLLGVALVRCRAVPVWAGIALCLWPVAEMAGEASGLVVVAAGGFALLVMGFGACAVGLVRAGRSSEVPGQVSGPVGAATQAIA